MTTRSRKFQIGKIQIGGKGPLFLIAGPCVIENERATLQIAEKLKRITSDLKIPWIFKASFDKANRSSINSYRGPGMMKGLRILARVKEEFSVPVLSDIHEPAQAERAAEVLDVIQIPAFLCRQTDLILAAAATKKPLNLKKGQFLSPQDMKNVIEKAESGGAKKIMVTERGSSFGYSNLVVDMRSLVIMRSFGWPVVFDATHSVQLPGGLGHSSGGQREFVAPLARAAAAVGVDGIFLEVHPRPEQALCDGPNMIPLSQTENLLKSLLKIRKAISGSDR
jgi:2-dehydro-3-deoxyphosphooctonate aldolase (KDO 8-P synthase)